ncbi:MAG: hypothetical protein RLZZ15_762 [Verrucomicrobiota bacterium]|jgi:hypothetical protein
MNSYRLFRFPAAVAAVLAALAASAPGALAADDARSGVAPAADSLTGVAEVGVGSHYIFRGVRRADTNLEANVELNYGAFSGGVWVMRPRGRGFQDESAFSLGVHGTIGSGAVWDFGGTLRDYPGANRAAGATRRSFETQLGSTVALSARWAATGYLYYDFNLRAWTEEGRLTWRSGLAEAPLVFIFDAFAGHTSARDLLPEAPRPKWDESYSYYGSTLRAEWRCSPRFSVTPGVQYSDHLNLRGGTATSDTWWWFVRASYRF